VPHTLRVDPRAPDVSVIREAAAMIREGLVVAYPTDTLYGLAVDPRNAEAVRRLYDLKGRAESSALTLIAADAGQAQAAGQMTAAAARLASRWWPGPVTIVVPARATLAREVLAGGTTVGIRVPDHFVVRALLAELGEPILSTTLILPGESAPLNDAEVIRDRLEKAVDAVIDAGPCVDVPTTVVDLATEPPTITRYGGGDPAALGLA